MNDSLRKLVVRHAFLSDLLANYVSAEERRPIRSAARKAWDAAFHELQEAEKVLKDEYDESACLDAQESLERLEQANATYKDAAEKERNAYLEYMHTIRPASCTEGRSE